jgi:peptidoglycan/xylan/chitin deacetylase (PgdA/CDA1 family)
LIFFVFILSLLSVVGVLFFQPRFLLRFASSIIPDVVYFKQTDQKFIALTIDDGPNRVTTTKILDVLDKYGARATFFVIGENLRGNEDIVQRMVDNGHELGNHLMEDKPSISLSSQEFESDLVETGKILRQFGRVQWLRPASGWHNHEMVRIAHRHDYRVVLGSIFPFDTHIPSSWFASVQILVNASPGSIIVLHDTQLWGERTRLTLEKVIPQLMSRGYEFVTLSDLFAQKVNIASSKNQ